MFLRTDNPRTIQLSGVDDYLLNWLDTFLIDREASGVADGTLRFYRQKIKLFSNYCGALTVKLLSFSEYSIWRVIQHYSYGFEKRCYQN